MARPRSIHVRRSRGKLINLVQVVEGTREMLLLFVEGANEG